MRPERLSTRFTLVAGLLAGAGGLQAQEPAIITTNPYLGWPISEFDSRVSPFSPVGALNPFTTEGGRIYGQDGTYLGQLNANLFDPESVANPYGRYGSPYSSTSINNPFSQYGSAYSNLSARNPLATAPPVVIWEPQSTTAATPESRATRRRTGIRAPENRERPVSWPAPSRTASPPADLGGRPVFAILGSMAEGERLRQEDEERRRQHEAEIALMEAEVRRIEAETEHLRKQAAQTEKILASRGRVCAEVAPEAVATFADVVAILVVQRATGTRVQAWTVTTEEWDRWREKRQAILTLVESLPAVRTFCEGYAYELATLHEATLKRATTDRLLELFQEPVISALQALSNDGKDGYDTMP